MNDYVIRWVEGTPVLSLHIEGYHDVGRMLARLRGGRVELGNLAEKIATEFRHGHGTRGRDLLDHLEYQGGPEMGIGGLRKVPFLGSRAI